MIYSQPQESERSAIKTLASQHLRDLQAMHEQFSQDIQAVRDQHKDVRNNHKKEMKEAEKKNARMITMLDKVIECQDNQMRHHEVERKQERELREKAISAAAGATRSSAMWKRHWVRIMEALIKC